MTPRTSSVGMSVTIAVLLVAGPARAQSSGERPLALGGSVGASYEHAEDAGGGVAPGGGVLMSIRATPRWGADAELWVPAPYREAGGAEHRDILFSVAVRRTLAGSGVRPYWLAGFSLGRTESRFTTCLAYYEAMRPTVVDCASPDVVERRTEHVVGTSTFGLVGVGLTIPIASCMHVGPDIRFHVTTGSLIVRPGFVFAFEF